MEHEIINCKEKTLVGHSIKTSIAENKTQALWQGFMPIRKSIKNMIDGIYYSVEVYHDDIKFSEFTPQTQFQKWACVEVKSIDTIPDGMATISIPEGLYAVFTHLGPTTEFYKTHNFIFQEWLPKSEYELDNRPHFEVMDEQYLGPMHPDSEEKVWVPIKES